MATDEERRTLLEHARAGDVDALVQLVTLNTRPAFKLAHRILCINRGAACRFDSCPSRPDIEDVVQSVVVVVLERFNAFRGDDPVGFEGWMLGVTANKAKKFLRSKTKPERHSGKKMASLDHAHPSREGESRSIEPADPRANSYLERIAAAEEIGKLLSRLSPTERFVITRIYFDGRTVSQVAEELGWKEQAIYYNLRRALERMR